MPQVIGNSPAGQIESVENLKKRQRSIYWRPINNDNGEVIGWIETQLLPSDSSGRELYFSKGFRLSPPKDEEHNDGFTVQVDSEKEELLAENERLRKLLLQQPHSPQRKVARKK
jgi:hypothetical protein